MGRSAYLRCPNVAFMNIRSASTRLLRYRLENPVGGSGVASFDLLATRVVLEDEVEGFGFSYVLGGGGAAALACARLLEERLLAAKRIDHPEATWRTLAATLNRSRRGPNYIALAAIDVAVWDAYAKALGVPLAVAMGGTPRAVPVYGSGGFNARQTPEQAAEVARQHVASGFRGVKPRVACARADEFLLTAVRDAIAANTELMVDANEKGSPTTAARLVAMAQESGALFIEEPLPADDVEGYRALSRMSSRIATGEHLQGCLESLPFVSQRLCAVIQPDLAMAGGLTECLRIARIAEAFGVEVSPHFLPGLFVHLAAAAPNLSWLEDFPLIEPLFEGWPRMSPDGMLMPGNMPGHGLTLAAGALEKYAT